MELTNGKEKKAIKNEYYVLTWPTAWKELLWLMVEKWAK